MAAGLRFALAEQNGDQDSGAPVASGYPICGPLGGNRDTLSRQFRVGIIHQMTPANPSAYAPMHIYYLQ